MAGGDGIQVLPPGAGYGIVSSPTDLLAKIFTFNRSSASVAPLQSLCSALLGCRTDTPLSLPISPKSLTQLRGRLNQGFSHLQLCLLGRGAQPYVRSSCVPTIS